MHADVADPVGVSTWGNSLQGLAKFKDKGDKLLTFHGTQNPVRRTRFLLVESHRAADLNSRDRVSV